MKDEDERDLLWKLREDANPTRDELKEATDWANEQSRGWATQSGYLVWQDLPTMYEAGYWKGVLAERKRATDDKSVNQEGD